MWKLPLSWGRQNRCAAGCALLLYGFTGVLAAAEPPPPWTLENSIRRVIEIAPETQAAQAEVSARQGALRQAGAWPNPAIELRADDKIGTDSGRGGNDLTQFAFSQPLPLSGRIGHQKAVAGAELAAAQAERRYQQLLLETEAAKRYHALQLAAERFVLAAQRHQLADEFQIAGRRREQAGDMAELERLRLDLIRESARQMLDKAEGEYEEALGEIRAWLGLPAEALPQPTPLEPYGPLAPLEQLQADLPAHPALLAANQRLEAASSGVALARAGRLPDPDLRLFRERDFLNGRRQEVNGIGIGITVPLWDRNSGGIGERRAQMRRARAELQALERDLSSRLRQSHRHLSHLLQQGAHYRTQVFEPARRVFDLTRKAYASGEVAILSLIDANNTYFETRERYLELLQEAWLEAADLRLAAGRALVSTEVSTEQDSDDE